MTKRLDSIDWLSLGVPEMPHWLEDMVSYDIQKREVAYNSFYDSGVIEINTATPYVIPFLIDYLASESTPRKDAILQLLIVLASEADGYVKHPRLTELAKTVLTEIAKGMRVFEPYQQIDDTKELAVQLLTYIK
ncbi:MAG: hypothetical protein U0894_20850 [Pirellulales bacterium]